MIDEARINRALVRVLRLIIDDNSYKVIQAEQNKSRPKRPYCTFHVLGIFDDMLEEYSTLYDSETNVGYRNGRVLSRVLVSFKFFYKNSFGMATRVKRGLYREGIQNILLKNGMGVLERRKVRNATEKLENGFEERASFDATFSIVDLDTEFLKSIESAEISANIFGETNTIVVDQDTDTNVG